MPKRILLADDSITIQKVVELTFSDGDYEVTAVNNGNKAIQKLSEMRPDIILSDIIMPEKNGYEVCEFVKSHPEFRTIPVVLLTGTFEPFDPDRADKAGCDAVVTKPFESQSLIQKVEELIDSSRSQAPASAPAAAPAPAAETPFAAAPHPAAASNQFATGTFQPQSNDIFGAPTEPPPAAPADTPFDTGAATGGETRAFPRMSFEDLSQMASAPAAPPPAAPSGGGMFASSTPEASPWDEPAATGGETKAFPKMSFDDLQRSAAPAPPPAAAPEPPTASEPASPWDEPAPAGGETKAFPRMSFDELQNMATGGSAAAPPAPAPAPPPEPEVSPWDSAPSSPPPAPPDQPASPWDEPAAGSGETKAFPRMSFEELQQLAKEEAQAPASAPPPPPPPAPAPMASASTEAEESPFSSSSSFSSTPSAPEPSTESAPMFAPTTPSPAPAAASSASGSREAGDLSDEQIDRIARRVVELMSDQIVRNIAWEVIPDMAEMVVKERIRQLESEN